MEDTPKKELISLEDYNSKQKNNWRALEALRQVKNGIACPECGAELFDLIVCILTSFPPQIQVNCVKCGFIGSRVI